MEKITDNSSIIFLLRTRRSSIYLAINDIICTKERIAIHAEKLLKCWDQLQNQSIMIRTFSTYFIMPYESRYSIKWHEHTGQFLLL